jgi:hypothetical protein
MKIEKGHQHKNGAVAIDGATVLYKRFNGQIGAGTIHSIKDSGSCYVAIVTPGGVFQENVRVQDTYPATDAFAAIESKK